MKLFITNKSEFEIDFDAPERFQNSQRKPLTSQEIHKKAFAILSKSIDVDYSIPIGITPNYDSGEGIAILVFKTKRDDIYYYEYTGTAS